MREEEGTVRLNLRLPTSLHRKLQELARENRRSLNSEIVGALDMAVNRDESRRVKEIEDTIGQLAIDVQRIKEGLLPLLPPETIALLENAERVAASRGGKFHALLEEALRKVVDEEQSE